MDKNLLSVLGTMLVSSGVFAVFTYFNSPNLSKPFLGNNPFAIKKTIVDGFQNTIFVILVSLGTLFQVLSLAANDDLLPARTHSATFYVFSGLVSFGILFYVVKNLEKLSKRFTKNQWLSSYRTLASDAIANYGEIAKNQGLRLSQVGKLHASQLEETRSANIEDLQNWLKTVEEYLDIFDSTGDYKSRYDRVINILES